MDEVDQVVLVIEPEASQRIGGPSRQDDGVERHAGCAHPLQNLPVLAVAHAPERLAGLSHRAGKPEGEVVPEPAAPGQVEQDERLAGLLPRREQRDLAVVGVSLPEGVAVGVSQCRGDIRHRDGGDGFENHTVSFSELRA